MLVCYSRPRSDVGRVPEECLHVRLYLLSVWHLYVPGREVSVGEVPYLITSWVRTMFRISLLAECKVSLLTVWMGLSRNGNGAGSGRGDISHTRTRYLYLSSNPTRNPTGFLSGRPVGAKNIPEPDPKPETRYRPETRPENGGRKNRKTTMKQLRN